MRAVVSGSPLEGWEFSSVQKNPEMMGALHARLLDGDGFDVTPGMMGQC